MNTYNVDNWKFSSFANTKKISMTVAIASDHAGFELKQYLIKMLRNLKIDVKDFGPPSAEPVDYPTFAHPVADFIEKNSGDLGVLICGSGNGVAMTANKHSGIRAALCWTAEVAQLARKHNDANILCLPARFIDQDMAVEMTKTFITTEFEGGRHERRVKLINNK